MPCLVTGLLSTFRSVFSPIDPPVDPQETTTMLRNNLMRDERSTLLTETEEITDLECQGECCECRGQWRAGWSFEPMGAVHHSSLCSIAALDDEVYSSVIRSLPEMILWIPLKTSEKDPWLRTEQSVTSVRWRLKGKAKQGTTSFNWKIWPCREHDWPRHDWTRKTLVS